MKIDWSEVSLGKVCIKIGSAATPQGMKGCTRI